MFETSQSTRLPSTIQGSTGEKVGKLSLPNLLCSLLASSQLSVTRVTGDRWTRGLGQMSVGSSSSDLGASGIIARENFQENDLSVCFLRTDRGSS